MQHEDISNHGQTVDGEVDWVKEYGGRQGQIRSLSKIAGVPKIAGLPKIVDLPKIAHLLKIAASC